MLVSSYILFEPYRLVDADGVVVVPAAAYFRELAACGRPAATHRSYGMAMLRWWRFLWAVEVRWDQATRAEGFLLVDTVRRQTGAAALALSRGWCAGGGDGAGGGRDAEPRDGEAFSRAWLRHGDGGALRERATRFL